MSDRPRAPFGARLDASTALTGAPAPASSRVVIAGSLVRVHRLGPHHARPVAADRPDDVTTEKRVAAGNRGRETDLAVRGDLEAHANLRNGRHIHRRVRDGI